MQTAALLLSQFAVAGRFYEAPIAGHPEKLRDRLEITPHGWSAQRIANNPPDLLVIMMNPGASRPLEALWSETEAAGVQGLVDDCGPVVDDGLAPAVPDRTQYQIMRLLLAAQAKGLPWQHARVLNLSDLRTPKSAELIAKLALYAADDSHSIFSSQRQADFKTWAANPLVAKPQTPVLCGWGLNPALAPLAQRALHCIHAIASNQNAASERKLLGITADNMLYRHPLPQRHDMQLQWLADVAAQV